MGCVPYRIMTARFSGRHLGQPGGRSRTAAAA